MEEHDDDLEIIGPPARTRNEDAILADAIANGFERLAAVLERGLRELADALTAAREGPNPRQHASHHR
jgi:hypothetical protein